MCMTYIIDGEANFFIQKLIDLYTRKGFDTCVTRVRMDYSFVEEPSPQKRCIDQARAEYYCYASDMYPARKGMECKYEDHLCCGSDAVGCTYCCIPDTMYYDDDLYY